MYEPNVKELHCSNLLLGSDSVCATQVLTAKSKVMRKRSFDIIQLKKIER